MNIIQSIKKGRNYIDQKVERVSEAELNDSVFFDQEEIVDPNTGSVREDIINKVNKILSVKGLTVVMKTLKECSNGNYRSFIGSANWQPTSTLLE